MDIGYGSEVEMLWRSPTMLDELEFGDRDRRKRVSCDPIGKVWGKEIPPVACINST